MKSNYKVNVDSWEFIILGCDREGVINKVINHLDGLIVKDGYTTMAILAKENIENKRYSLEEYHGFVLV